jgi:sorbitol-specific phosphotransferase system component IIBC
MTTEQIFIGVDDQVIELTGADKEAFLAQREADNAERQAREAEQAAKAEQKAAILERLGLTEDELKVVLGA